VKLVGDDGNQAAIGASMRLVFAEKHGPVREIHAGSGYWSQDGAIQVLATAEQLKEIWIRWPGGKTTTSDIPSNANFIEVRSTGALRVLR
jgi:hypothetical protein